MYPNACMVLTEKLTFRTQYVVVEDDTFTRTVGVPTAVTPPAGTPEESCVNVPNDPNVADVVLTPRMN